MSGDRPHVTLNEPSGSGARFGHCDSSASGGHARRAISYEKVYEPPRMEQRGRMLALTESAFYRYFVVTICDHCERTWWVEDHPRIDR